MQLQCVFEWIRYTCRDAILLEAEIYNEFWKRIMVRLNGCALGGFQQFGRFPMLMG